LSKDKQDDKQENLGALEQLLLLNSQGSGAPSPELRLISLYGEVDEERAAEIAYTLLVLKETGISFIIPEDADPETEPTQVCEPIKFMISTYGGTAADMFSIYDVMRMIRDECEIHTFALGKVMSAGVLLLAAGTKGERLIGKHCRIMLHGVVGGSHGAIHNLENEMDEIRWLQEQHTKCLVEETNLTKRELKRMLNRKVNVYLTAEEAVKFGIADRIV